MKIFLTGGRGYKGQALCKALASAGHEVTSCDIGWFESPGLSELGVKDVIGSTMDVTATDLAGIDVIIHLAAVANDPSGDINSKLTWETNVLGTNKLAVEAIKAGVGRFIFASSGSVYGIQGAEHVTEEIEPLPISDYNKTKWIGERVLQSYSDKLNLQIIRPGTVCGVSPRQRFDVVVNLLCEQAISKGELTVHGGDQQRPHIHIDDMCSVYLFMLANPHLTGTFNAAFENLSVTELAEYIAESSGATLRFTESTDPRSYRMNSDKLLKSGFIPKKSVKDAVVEVTDALKSGDLKFESLHYNVKWMTSNIV